MSGAGYLSSLAAATYAAAGCFSTASVLARDAAQSQEAGPLERWVNAVLASHAGRLDDAQVPTGMREYVEAERAALQTGTSGAFDEADRRFRECAPLVLDLIPDSDCLLLLTWEQIRQRFRQLSTARVLAEANELPEQYVSTLVRDNPLLYPTQADAVAGHPILGPEHNVILTLPTSTGKSLLGELAIVSSLRDERPLGVYIAPYRALADQVQHRMRDRLERAGIECEIRRGGYLSDRPIRLERRTVLVSTPEALDCLLRQRPELYSQIACCVFDEFHLIEQAARGPRYEGLVARMAGGAKLVTLSPVVDPHADLTDWLRVPQDCVVQSRWRPTARRIAVVHTTGYVEYFTPGEHLNGDQAASSWTGRLSIRTPLPAPPSQPYALLLAAYDEAVAQHVAAVTIDRHQQFRAPVLVLVASKAQTRSIAREVALRMGEQPTGNAAALGGEIRRRHPYLPTLATCLRHGVAYHNAALPSWVRERLEQLMERGEIGVVVATTTLAEGVDLPFRVVVMADWLQWQFGRLQPMSTLLFRNIAGRCGRAGRYAEGDTLIVDNPGRAPGSVAPARHREYMDRYVRPALVQLRSAVVSAAASNDARSYAEVIASLESQFVAFVDSSSPEEGQEERAFTAALLAGRHADTARRIEADLSGFVQDMLAETEFPVLQRSSPLRLTPFGQATLPSGLSPRSTLSLARTVRAGLDAGEPRRGRAVRAEHAIEWIPLLAALAAQLVDASADAVAELRAQFSRMSRRGSAVKEKNFETVLLAWTSGVPVEQITLVAIRERSGPGGKAGAAAAERWLRSDDDQPPPQRFEDDIEAVASLLGSYVSQQWGWVVRCAAAAAGVILGTAASEYVELEALAKRVEHGVRNTEAAEWLERGCPLDRAKLDQLVSLWKAAVAEGDASAFPDWVRAQEPNLTGVPVGPYLRCRLTQSDVRSLAEFLVSPQGRLE